MLMSSLSSISSSPLAPPRVDTSLTSAYGSRHPGLLTISGAESQPNPAALPSALATARIIENLGSIQYPEGVKSPKPELNVNAKQGKFRYDRDFLLQFRAVCKEKPDCLPPLGAIGLEPVARNFPTSRGGSQGRRSSSNAMAPPSRQASVGLGISGLNKPTVNPGPFTMNQFSTPNQKTTSDERFAASERSTSMSGGPAGIPFGCPSPMVPSNQSGPSEHPSGGRTRSQRGGKRTKERPSAPPGQGTSSSLSSSLAGTQNPEPVVPSLVSANRWTPASLQPLDLESPEVVDTTVRSLLNKLTMERFDPISDQIIAWANRSEKERDGRTLIQVTRLVFERAKDEAACSDLCARLCRKMMEQISLNVHDDGIKNAKGKPIGGGQLFHKYLLNCCQEEFERGWVAPEADATAAATKVIEGSAAEVAAEQEERWESVLYADESDAAQKAKRQGVGVIRFIGELFKLQMLTGRIMHEWIKKLLGNVESPVEEEIERLCTLVTTIGQVLDTPKARAHVDVYFSRMKELTKSPSMNSRMQRMLQDVIDLRDRRWVPKNQMAAPTTIAGIHEQAAKADDLSKFGKIDMSAAMTFGPSSIFQKGNKSKSRESIIRQGNMFSMLSGNPEMASEVTGKSSRWPSRESSFDLDWGDAPDGATPPNRRKLQLLSRSVPLEDKSESTPSASPVDSEEVPSNTRSLSEAEAKVRIEEDSKEFFSVRDLQEAEIYFTKLPSEHRHLLVDKLVTKAVESKRADAQLVADLFDRAVSRNLCSPTSFEKGFTPTAEIIDDLAIDAPKAMDLLAIMIKGAHL